MIIKFKILAVWPEVRGVDVQFYTDQFPEGSRSHVTIYPDPMPTGQALIDYIMSYAPRDWLAIKTKCAVALPDMSELENLMGEEQAMEVSTPPELGIIPISELK